MPKIMVELEVLGGEYCEREDNVCPMCLEGNWGTYYCCLFNADLEMDANNKHYCKRCDECKQAEVKEQ